MNKSIVLIGFKSVGKTTLGEALAKKLDMHWLDTDILLADKMGCEVRELYLRLGETEFREQEIQVFKDIVMLPNVVISTGGGIVEHSDFKNTVDASSCLTIHMVLDWVEICHRIKENPAFSQGRDLKEIYQHRLGLYQQAADVEIDVSRLKDNHG